MKVTLPPRAQGHAKRKDKKDRDGEPVAQVILRDARRPGAPRSGAAVERPEAARLDAGELVGDE